MPASTLLAIDGIGLGDYATRGLTMTLAPIDAGELARDINGNLLDFTLEQFRKYAATIECDDHEAPELTDIWRGSVVTVTCIPQLGVISDATDGTLILTMMVNSWETKRDEYGAHTGWRLELLQV